MMDKLAGEHQARKKEVEKEEVTDEEEFDAHQRESDRRESEDEELNALRRENEIMEGKMHEQGKMI